MNTVPRIPVAEVLADGELALRVEDRHPRTVPVPHGERSIAPVQVDGFARSTVPVDTVTTLRLLFAGSRAGPVSSPIVMPAKPGCSGMDHRQLLAAAALISSVTRVMSRPSSGVSRNPNGARVGDDVEHPAVRDVDGDGAERRDLDRRVEMGRERRHVPERDAGHLAVGADARRG